MKSATIQLLIPDADVPQNADPERLMQRINAEVDALRSGFQEQKVSLDGPRKKPVPEGVAGISESVTWALNFYIDNKNEVDTFLSLLPHLLRGISAAAKYFMPSQKKGKRGKEDHHVIVSIGGEVISLPASSDSIDDFVSSINKQLSKQ